MRTNDITDLVLWEIIERQAHKAQHDRGVIRSLESDLRRLDAKPKRQPKLDNDPFGIYGKPT